MSDYYRESDQFDHYRIANSSANQAHHFAPSIQSLKAAQDIVLRDEKRRRAVARRNRQSRGTVTLPASLSVAVGDNIIPFRSRVMAKPSSRLFHSPHYSPTYRLSSSIRIRRAAVQRKTLQSTGYDAVSAPSPVSAPEIFRGLQFETLERLGVVVIQALAVILGLSSLLALLMLV